MRKIFAVAVLALALASVAVAFTAVTAVNSRLAMTCEGGGCD
jgi:hypothetical protein